MYQASFVGFFPAMDPKYSCIVVINNPKKGQVYGGKVAGPIFKELADKVFALDVGIHKPVFSDGIIKNLPDIKQGDFMKASTILDALGISSSQINAPYIVAKSRLERN